MSTMSLRLPESLHRRLREFAQKDDVSINQLITSAVAEKLAALSTLEYLEARAARGSRESFEAALALVPDIEPDEGDTLPDSVHEDVPTYYVATRPVSSQKAHTNLCGRDPLYIETNSFENIRHDYHAALDWLRSLGVQISSGRTQFYERVVTTWTESYRYASQAEGQEIFPDFVSSMYEVMDFIEIFKSLKDVPSSNLQVIAGKLQKGVNGPINSHEESAKSTEARNYIFEALVAARSHRPGKGVSTIFDAPSDTGIRIGGRKIWIECKRIASLNRLEANVRKACNQLEATISQKAGSGNRGLVAIDFTKVLHAGDKLFVKSNDEELVKGIDSITDAFIRQHSREWEKVYSQKNKKIIGTLVRFATMAVSEERNLLVRVSQWAINPKLGIKTTDENLLKLFAQAMN